MKIAYIAIPAIVGHNPRTISSLREALQISQNDWYLADPYAGVPKAWWFPASVALPLPGVNRRREDFVSAIAKDEALEALATRVSSLKKTGYDAVVAVSWSLGAWFALSCLEQFDGAILTSPMLESGQLQRIARNQAPDKPLLMVVGDADTDVPNAVAMCQTWDEREQTEVFLIEGAQHPFDQQLLREGGKLRNPLYQATQEYAANLAIVTFLKRHF